MALSRYQGSPQPACYNTKCCRLSGLWSTMIDMPAQSDLNQRLAVLNGLFFLLNYAPVLVRAVGVEPTTYGL